MKVKAKFWIENKGEVVAGGGKIALLLAVDRLGSIQQAAEEFEMSYRHAWGAIKRIEQRAGFRIVDTRPGGREGGARLTSRGRAFVEEADSLFKELQASVERQVKGSHHAALGK